jgi:hypothetical protein
VSGGFVPGFFDPAFDGNSILPEQQVQLGGVFLHMAHAVELQLDETDFAPWKLAA